MLAIKGDTAELPFLDNGKCTAELKYDGDRAVLHYRNDRVTNLFNRRGMDNLFRYPELLQLSLDCESCILDGELVVFDENGKSRFYQGIDLRTHLANPHEIQERSRTHPVTFIAFDIISLNGRAVSDLSLQKRKELLYAILAENTSDSIQQVMDFTSIAEAWSYVLENGEEGIIVKDLSSPYSERRSPFWIKYKNVKEADICFSDYEIHAKGITLTNGTHRVTCNGDQSDEVRRSIDEHGTALCTIRHLGQTDNGKYRQPTFLKMVA